MKELKKIESFEINHLKLLPGLYISRRDYLEKMVLTTFDMRMTRPNYEEVMETSAVHAIEHLGATFLRNHPFWQKKIIYFGPMGCRTGFYLIIGGDLIVTDILPLIKEMMNFILNFQGDIPGGKPENCGNYSDMDLTLAKRYAKKYCDEFLNYPSSQQMHYSK